MVSQELQDKLAALYVQYSPDGFTGRAIRSSKSNSTRKLEASVTANMAAIAENNLQAMDATTVGTDAQPGGTSPAAAAAAAATDTE